MDRGGFGRRTSLLGASWLVDFEDVYSGYERRILRALARAVPRHQRALAAAEKRLVDLHRIVKWNYYHPAFRGSFSIKAVLPVLCPDAGYGDLAIADGLTAAVRYQRALASDSERERRRAFADLRAYCQRDTLALVRLRHALRRASGEGARRVRPGRASMPRRSTSARQPHHLNPLPVTTEVLGVEGGEAALAVREHRRDDVGVVDLFAGKGHVSTQRDEHVRHRLAVFQHLEGGREPTHILHGVRHWQRRNPRLPARYHGKILAQHLTADAQGFGSSRSRQQGQRGFAPGLVGGAGGHQHIGV